MSVNPYNVVHVKKFNFTDKESGRTVKGCKVTYLPDPQHEENSKGSEPFTLSAPFELYDRFHQVPGPYHIDFTQKKSGKDVVLSIKDVAFAGAPKP